MKKLLLILLALAMCVSMCACSKTDSQNENNSTVENSNDESSISEPNVTYYHLGDTVSTDIVKFRLDDAAFAIALVNGGEKGFTPKEYDPVEDQKNPFVAKKGQTFVFYEYTVENLDRAYQQMHVGNFVTIEHNEQLYNTISRNKAIYYYKSCNHTDYFSKKQIIAEPYTWYMNLFGEDVALNTGEKQSHRVCIELNTEIANLNDDFIITFSLPTSSGEKMSFSYRINAN